MRRYIINSFLVLPDVTLAFFTEENTQFQAFYPVIVEIVFRYKVILTTNFDLIFYGNLNARIK